MCIGEKLRSIHGAIIFRSYPQRLVVLAGLMKPRYIINVMPSMTSHLTDIRRGQTQTQLSGL